MVLDRDKAVRSSVIQSTRTSSGSRSCLLPAKRRRVVRFGRGSRGVGKASDGSKAGQHVLEPGRETRKSQTTNTTRIIIMSAHARTCSQPVIPSGGAGAQAAVIAFRSAAAAQFALSASDASGEELHSWMKLWTYGFWLKRAPTPARVEARSPRRATATRRTDSSTLSLSPYTYPSNSSIAWLHETSCQSRFLKYIPNLAVIIIMACLGTPSQSSCRFAELGRISGRISGRNRTNVLRKSSTAAYSLGESASLILGERGNQLICCSPAILENFRRVFMHPYAAQ